MCVCHHLHDLGSLLHASLAVVYILSSGQPWQSRGVRVYVNPNNAQVCLVLPGNSHKRKRCAKKTTHTTRGHGHMAHGRRRRGNTKRHISFRFRTFCKSPFGSMHIRCRRLPSKRGAGNAGRPPVRVCVRVHVRALHACKAVRERVQCVCAKSR